MQVEFHPIAELFPLMTDEELKALAQDIKEHNQQEVIVTFEDKILDGRNRYLACKLANKAPMFIEFDPVTTGMTPEEYVFTANFHRRHLTAGQKAALAFEWSELMKKKRGGDRKSDQKLKNEFLNGEPETREKAAEKFGASEGYIQEVSELKKEAPEIYEEVKKGKKTLSEAKREAKKKDPEQVKALAVLEAAADGFQEAIETHKVRITPKQILHLAQQEAKAIKAAYAMLRDGMSYKEVAKTSTEVFDLESTLSDLVAKLAQSRQKIVSVQVMGWLFTVEKVGEEKPKTGGGKKLSQQPKVTTFKSRKVKADADGTNAD